DEVPAEGSSVPTVPPGASDLLVIGGVAETRARIVAAHRPDGSGERCRACGHVYASGVQVCPAAAEAAADLPPVAVAVDATDDGQAARRVVVVWPRRRLTLMREFLSWLDRSLGHVTYLLVLPAAAVYAMAEVVPFLTSPRSQWAVFLLSVGALSHAVNWMISTWRRRRAARRGGDGLEPLV
ncbi:MAG TPA: hypothetical protein VIS06_06305, partial [Mycobacteriales bacterium]